YLDRMARNRAYRCLRDERAHAEKHEILKRQASAQTPGSEEPAARLDAEILNQKLRAWIGALPERQREALLLSRFHGLSHREIAAIMGVSPRTVNNHIVRALEHLQERVETFEPTRMEP
ncbi:MAG: RNA polymerase sigma factor, partial [Rhodothermales bacterium]